MAHFKNRMEAGKLLAKSLSHYANDASVLVLGLPRGGVPVAYEVARYLNAPLDVFIVRKLGAPGNPELAIGAIASDEQIFLNDELIQMLHISEDEINKVMQAEKIELIRREQLYRAGKPGLALKDKTIVLVDDGIATGASMHTAVKAIHLKKPKKLVIAVPVAPLDVCTAITAKVDEFICLQQPTHFYSVGTWYEHFEQTSDEEVIRLLERANKNQ